MRMLDYRRCRQCSIYASFGYPGQGARYCVQHRLPGMMNVRRKICLFCPNYAHYGYVTSIVCRKHRTPDMLRLDKEYRHCNLCHRRALFSSEPNTIPTHCWDHHLPGMFRRSEINKCHCSRPAIYGYPQPRQTLLCRYHYLPGMIPLFGKCQDCSENGYFSYHPQSSRVYCPDHVIPGMINLTHQYCSECLNPARYGLEYPTHCQDHKSSGMQIISEKCHKCSKPAKWCYDRFPMMCFEHRGELTHINNLRCLDCSNFALFGYEIENRRMYCQEHSLPGMIKI